MWRAVDVAAAATCRRQNADEYKSMEIVAVAFVRRTRQKIEIQNKLLIISVHIAHTVARTERERGEGVGVGGREREKNGQPPNK